MPPTFTGLDILPNLLQNFQKKLIIDDTVEDPMFPSHNPIVLLISMEKTFMLILVLIIS